ncbi:toll/interleukin-1 receptor domain-containing protein [Marinoscillum sp. 108]|uniref:toll/interleukin-1 receptor domain-containing protein n=1 Tax=Marinoscillum sp. 108 TaxID=2653151 RepID=UPI0012F0FBDA|nr:toll/interleukin-1 receptor domain-containing protein [Marinoscillum sp. 108]VXD14245.1 hypothetical protein MARINOS108_11823 [Marinoscillum sp. 108]
MRKKLFISYSDFDKEKIELIISELENHNTFEPLVIASNREALKPLVKKVTDGIESSFVIIPILTAKSISTQWINQEIGYSIAIKKSVKPIVEHQIIKSLKGFIHKQVDLPYSYESQDEKEIENTNFLKAFRDLVSDLESEEEPSGKQESKNPFDETLERVERLKTKRDFERKRQSFLESTEAVEKSEEEVLRMFDLIKQRLHQLREKGVNFGTEEDPNQPSFVFRSNGFSCSFYWVIAYSNSTSDAKLWVKYWKGHFTSNNQAIFYPGNEPQENKAQTFALDVDEDFNFIWRINTSKLKTEEIVNDAFNWIFDRIGEKGLN